MMFRIGPDNGYPLTFKFLFVPGERLPTVVHAVANVQPRVELGIFVRVFVTVGVPYALFPFHFGDEQFRVEYVHRVFVFCRLESCTVGIAVWAGLY